MARQVSGYVRVIVEFEEVETDSGLASGNARVQHTFDKKYEFTSGNDAVTKVDRIFSSDGSVTTSPTDLDLVGTSLTSSLSSTVTVPGGVAVMMVSNEATSAAGTINVGGAAVPWDDWVIAAADGVKVPSGGILLWVAPLTDESPAAGASDELRLVASTGTIASKVLVVGRSA